MRDAENIHLELDKQIAVYIYTKSPRKFIKANVDNYTQYMPYFFFFFKVEMILKGSLDSIPSPSSSVKIQIMTGNLLQV